MNVPGSKICKDKYNTNYFATLNVATHKLSITVQECQRRIEYHQFFSESLMAIIFVKKISVLLRFVVLFNTHPSLPQQLLSALRFNICLSNIQ